MDIRIIVLCVILSLAVTAVQGSCGGYLKPTSTGSGKITSPNYPNNYRNNINCVWLLQAEAGYAITLTITGISGEYDTSSNYTECEDYVEIRNGSSVQTILYYECNEMVTATVQARWLWLKFRSNYINVNSGFTATWSVVTDASTTDLSSPFVYCPMEFGCENKECIAWSYKCDGYNDCGCEEGDCDELKCDGLGFSMPEKIGLGVGVGVGFFIITFFGIGILDIYLKKRSERKYQERIEKQKKLQKQKKAKAMAALFVSQPSEGSRKSSVVTSTQSPSSRRTSMFTGPLHAPSVSTISNSNTKS